MSQDNLELPPPPPPLSAHKWNMKVVGLSVVCIVLAASLIAVLVVYQPTSLQAQLNDRDKKIADLQQQVDALQALGANGSNYAPYILQIANLQQQLDSMNTNLTTMTAQLNAAQVIIQMGASTSLVAQQPINADADAFNGPLQYAGYIVVQASNTTIETLWSSYNINYDQNATLGISGSAAFPVLPGTVEVKVLGSASTVSVTYYY